VFNVPVSTSAMRFRITNGVGGVGDADLYTRVGGSPSLSDFTCRPYIGGNAETCLHLFPAPGDWYAMLQGFDAYSNVNIEARTGVFGGYGAQFASTQQWNSGFLLGQRFTAPITGSASHVGLINTGIGTNTRIGIYSNRLNIALQPEPGNLLGTAIVSVTTAGLKVAQLPADVPLTAGTQYWLVILNETLLQFQGTGILSEEWVTLASPYANGLPAVFPVGANRGTYSRMNLFTVIF
jgi:hypothetical protein